MFDSFLTTLDTWNRTTTERQKLQHTYVVLLMVIIFLAGIISLFNGERSRQVIYVALAIVTTLVVNFVMWGLLNTTVLDKLPKQSKSVKSKNNR